MCTTQTSELALTLSFPPSGGVRKCALWEYRLSEFHHWLILFASHRATSSPWKWHERFTYLLYWVFYSHSDSSVAHSNYCSTEKHPRARPEVLHTHYKELCSWCSPPSIHPQSSLSLAPSLLLYLSLSNLRSDGVYTMGVKTLWAPPLINSVCVSLGHNASRTH